MFQYKNSQIIAIIQISAIIWTTTMKPSYFLIFFYFFFVFFSLKRLVLVCFGWWVVDWDKRFSLLLLILNLVQFYLLSRVLRSQCLLSRLSFLRPLSLGEGAVPAASDATKNIQSAQKDTNDSACQYKKLQIQMVCCRAQRAVNALAKLGHIMSFPLLNSKIAD